MRWIIRCMVGSCWRGELSLKYWLSCADHSRNPSQRAVRAQSVAGSESWRAVLDAVCCARKPLSECEEACAEGGGRVLRRHARGRPERENSGAPVSNPSAASVGCSVESQRFPLGPPSRRCPLLFTFAPRLLHHQHSLIVLGLDLRLHSTASRDGCDGSTRAISDAHFVVARPLGERRCPRGRAAGSRGGSRGYFGC